MNMKKSPNNMNTENFSRGLYRVEIPELGEPFRGKVRDNWVIEKKDAKLRVMVTTDRQSAFVRNICTIPGKGQISNLISAYWFERTKDIVQNHMISILHPNVLIAKQAVAVIPVEVVLRRYMAKGLTRTSVYFNYVERGRREIYGIKFPDGLLPNQEFPMGTILTPTTKAKNGHDQELTGAQAKINVDTQFGNGIWNKVSVASHAIFEIARMYCLEKGLILADTKFEFGIDENGNIMLIDELLTPDSSRFWVKEKYEESFKKGEIPEFNKDILVRWLKEKGFDGKGEVPKIDVEVIEKMLEVYTRPYKMITGKDLPIPISDPSLIREIVLKYLN